MNVMISNRRKNYKMSVVEKVVIIIFLYFESSVISLPD